MSGLTKSSLRRCLFAKSFDGFGAAAFVAGVSFARACALAVDRVTGIVGLHAGAPRNLGNKTLNSNGGGFPASTTFFHQTAKKQRCRLAFKQEDKVSKTGCFCGGTECM